jgi:hypothetical protein
MRQVEVGKNMVSLRFSGEPVPQGQALQRLIYEALRQAGEEPWEELEMDCFSAGAESVVLARPGQPYRRCFFFPDWESLLGVASGCPAGESYLYQAEGGYVLAVARRAMGLSLYEFGQRLARGALWECHAQEQGQCLMEKNAIEMLHRAVPTGSNDCEIQ